MNKREPPTRVCGDNSLSVIVPVYNEQSTLHALIETLERDLLSLGNVEAFIVNDGSTDQTRAVMDQLSSSHIRCVHMEANQGKTAAVRKGLELARAEWVIIQDADLEYSPRDIGRLMEVAGGDRVAVFGKRPGCWHLPSRWAFAAGVLAIDLWLFVLYRRWVRDHATCYKLVSREMLERMDLQSTGFEGCVEITAKLMRMGVPIRQVPISYSPRPMSAGKKLKPSYFFSAMAAVWEWRNWYTADT